MKSAVPAETFAFRTRSITVGSMLGVLGCFATPAFVVGGIGVAIAEAMGNAKVQRAAQIVFAVLLATGLYFAALHWWQSRVTLRDSGEFISARYGPGGLLGRAHRFNKRAGVAIEHSGGHGVYALKLVQDRLSVDLGNVKHIFPDPYLPLVAWLRERGVYVIERWEYPQRPAESPVG